MTKSEQELIEALDKISDAFAMVVFLSIKNHPDQEMACEIADMLSNSRRLVAKYKEANQ